MNIPESLRSFRDGIREELLARQKYPFFYESENPSTYGVSPLCLINEIYIEAEEKGLKGASIVRHIMKQAGLPEVSIDETALGVNAFIQYERIYDETEDELKGTVCQQWTASIKQRATDSGAKIDHVLKVFWQLERIQNVFTLSRETSSAE